MHATLVTATLRAPQLSATLGIHAPVPASSRPGSVVGGLGGLGGSGAAAAGTAGLDPEILDQLITSLLGVQAATKAAGSAAQSNAAQVSLLFLPLHPKQGV